MKPHEDSNSRNHDGAEDRLANIVDDALEKWRNAIIDLTRRNKLLNFTPNGRSARRLMSPDCQAILDALAHDKCLRLVPGIRDDTEGDEDAAPWATRSRNMTEDTVVDGNAPQLKKVARYIRSQANRHYLDTGIHVMYLGFGMLNWADVDASAYQSPLFLVPVTCQVEVDSYFLRLAEEEPAINPALLLKLQEFGVQVESVTVDTVSAETFNEILDGFSDAIRGRKGWSVSNETWLTLFSFTKDAMYKDLLNNREVMARHPKIRALAASGSGLAEGFHLPEADLSDLSPEKIDENRPPERNPTVLDADASQRSVIAFAVSGHSAVVSGPPGTGKSQTITNMIAALMHAGKTVLFVSEKAAALDVVYNRLRRAGLDEYVLKLHSHKATRKAVADALCLSLNRAPHPPEAISPQERDAALRRREKLNAYAIAINEIRRPMERSLLDVMGVVSKLQDLPSPEPAGHLAQELNPQMLDRIDQAGHDLTRAWRPVLEGDGFLWTGIAEQAGLRHRIEQAMGDLRGFRQFLDANPALSRATTDGICQVK